MKSPKIKLNTTQGRLFFMIYKKLPRERSLVTELASALCKEESTIYKKLSGKTRLTLDEAGLLCRKFSIPMDDMQRLFKKSHWQHGL